MKGGVKALQAFWKTVQASRAMAKIFEGARWVVQMFEKLGLMFKRIGGSVGKMFDEVMEFFRGIFKWGEEVKVPKPGEGPGVYDLTTDTGKYIGQSKNFLKRVLSHFKGAAKLKGQNLIEEIYHAMPGSSKLEREVYEQYLIRQSGGPQALIEEGILLNKVNPMGAVRINILN